MSTKTACDLHTHFTSLHFNRSTTHFTHPLAALLVGVLQVLVTRCELLTSRADAPGVLAASFDRVLGKHATTADTAAKPGDANTAQFIPVIHCIHTCVYAHTHTHIHTRTRPSPGFAQSDAEAVMNSGLRALAVDRHWALRLKHVFLTCVSNTGCIPHTQTHTLPHTHTHTHTLKHTLSPPLTHTHTHTHTHSHTHFLSSHTQTNKTICMQLLAWLLFFPTALPPFPPPPPFAN